MPRKCAAAQLTSPAHVIGWLRAILAPSFRGMALRGRAACGRRAVQAAPVCLEQVARRKTRQRICRADQIRCGQRLRQAGRH